MQPLWRTVELESVAAVGGHDLAGRGPCDPLGSQCPVLRVRQALTRLRVAQRRDPFMTNAAENRGQNGSYQAFRTALQTFSSTPDRPFPSVSFGWSQLSLPFTVPLPPTGFATARAALVYIGALMLKAAAVVPGWEGGIQHAVRDPGPFARHLSSSLAVPTSRMPVRWRDPGPPCPRTAVDRSVERRPAAAHGAALPTVVGRPAADQVAKPPMTSPALSRAVDRGGEGRLA